MTAPKHPRPGENDLGTDPNPLEVSTGSFNNHKPMLETESAGQGSLELGQLTLPLESKLEPTPDWRSQVPTISQLTRRIRGHIENSFFDVWVRGEISNFRKPVSGHAYFCMKDATAQLKAVMFRPSLSKLKFELKDGMEILLHGKLTVYEARGEYQMVCDAVEPVGVGALQLAFDQLKAKLQKEGLFDKSFKKPLPYLPQRIGIVTSATGAAVKDILKVLSRRYPNLHVIIFPASVQGEKAAPEIVAAIDLAQRWNAEKPNQPIDVLIVGRGGGSLEDMWPFNEEIVARSIFKCAIPVISAVGHEIDFTIADFVADLRAPTPSAAAEIVVPKKEELVYHVEHRTERLQSAMQKRLDQTRLHLSHLGQRLVDPRMRAREMRGKFSMTEEKLAIAMRTRILLAKRRMESGVQMLHSLSPLQVIARGYSISQLPTGEIARSINQLAPGDRLTTRLGDGVVESEVVSKAPKAG